MTKDELKGRLLRTLQNATIHEILEVLSIIQEETADGEWDEGNCNRAKNIYLIRDVLDAIRCVTDVDIDRERGPERLENLHNMQILIDKIVVD